MTVEKPKPKQLLRPITPGTDNSMNQSQFLAITCNSPESREKWRVHGAIGFGFASHWLKYWRESFKPITTRSNRNHVITFDSHLKTALILLTFTSFTTNSPSQDSFHPDHAIHPSMKECCHLIPAYKEDPGLCQLVKLLKLLLWTYQPWIWRNYTCLLNNHLSGSSWEH